MRTRSPRSPTVFSSTGIDYFSSRSWRQSSRSATPRFTSGAVTLIDTGQGPGLKSYEADRLAQARRRIKDLEDELKLVKAASALFAETEVISPKGSTRLSEG